MYVRDRPVEVPDLMSSILKKVGVDYTKEYVSNIGRPLRVGDGNPLSFL
jgi:NurA-like 5'-3' nuclease